MHYRNAESRQSNGAGVENECPAGGSYRNRQRRGDLRMKKKYHLYLTAAERRYVFNTLLAYRHNLIAQGRDTDLMDEVMIKLQK